MNTARLLACIALTIVHALALTFSDPAADARSTTAPQFRFDPWEHGAVGIDDFGRTLGSPGTECYVWSVGPSAFVWSRHVSPQPSAAVVYRGVQYPLLTNVSLGSDVVLGIIDGRTPTWGAVWKGFGMVTNQIPSGWPPGFGFPATIERIVPISISNAVMAAISGGPGGLLHTNEPCLASDTRPPAKRWAAVTNCSLSLYGLSSIESLRRAGSTFEFDLVGPEFSIPFAAPGAVGNPGAWTGDSGGGVFIRGATGGWLLVGLMHAGGSCRGMSIDGPVVAEASFLRPELWTALGKPGREAEYAKFRAYFADAPNYDPAPASVPPAAPIPAPVQPTVQWITNTVTVPVFVTNSVTLYFTNVVTVTSSPPSVLTLQQRLTVERARQALQDALAVLGK